MSQVFNKSRYSLTSQGKSNGYPSLLHLADAEGMETEQVSWTEEEMASLTLLQYAIVMQRLGYQFFVGKPYSNLVYLLQIEPLDQGSIEQGLKLIVSYPGTTRSIREVLLYSRDAEPYITGSETWGARRRLVARASLGRLTEYAFRLRHVMRSFATVLAEDLISSSAFPEAALRDGGALKAQAYGLAEPVPVIAMTRGDFDNKVVTRGGVNYLSSLPRLNPYSASDLGVGFTAAWSSGHYGPLAISSQTPVAIVQNEIVFDSQQGLNELVPIMLAALGEQNQVAGAPGYWRSPDRTLPQEVTRDQAIAIVCERGWDVSSACPVTVAHEAILDPAISGVVPVARDPSSGAPRYGTVFARASEMLYTQPLLSADSLAILPTWDEEWHIIDGTLDVLFGRIGNPQSSGFNSLAEGIWAVLNRIGRGGDDTVMSLLLDLAEGSNHSAEDVSNLLSFLRLQQRVTQKLILKTTAALDKKPALTQAENLAAATVGSLAAEISKGK